MYIELEYIFSQNFVKIVIQCPNWFMNILFFIISSVYFHLPTGPSEGGLSFYSLSSMLHTLQTRYLHSLNISAGTECATQHDLTSGTASQPPAYVVQCTQSPCDCDLSESHLGCFLLNVYFIYCICCKIFLASENLKG